MANRIPKIGIAFGAGGARGLANVGVVNILSAEGINIDMVAGSSMGSFIAACVALGIDLNEVMNDFKDIKRRQILSKLYDFHNPAISLVKGKKAFDVLKRYLGASKFSDAKMPLRIIATDLSSGDEVVIDKGSIFEAVCASCSVPGIFPPVSIDNKYLIDGGIANPTPVNRLEDMGADIVIGIDLIMKTAKIVNKPKMMETLLRSYEIVRSMSVKYHLEKTSKDVVMLYPKLRNVTSSFKFYDMNSFIKSGEEAAIEALPEIKKRIENFSKM